jgi:hypothetical protein
MLTTTATQPLKAVGKYVNTQHVDEMIRNYKKERWVHNTERLGKEDSLSGWYSLKEMEDFLETAKTHGADGVRFYFGVYAAAYQEIPEYAGRQTLVLVPTKNKPTEEGSLNKDIYITSEASTSILAYNSIHMCPPRCGGGDVDTGLSGMDDFGLGITIIDKGEKGSIVI